MSFLQLEHHGYFHGVSRNNTIEYTLGRKNTSSQRVWELGTVQNNIPNNGTTIRLNERVRLRPFTPQRRENLEAVNQLAHLGPLTFWMQENPDIVTNVGPNILSNRGILKNLCLPPERWDYSFLVRVDQEGRYVFHTVPLNTLDENEDLTGFALENFMAKGDDFDYREKSYTVQSLTLNNWKILYNAEYDGFLNIPLWPLNTGQDHGYNITKAVPVEMKLCSDRGNIRPWRFQNWFAQTQLGNIDDVIIGMNPNGRRDDPELTEIKLYKTQDFPRLSNWDPREMLRNLERALVFIQGIPFNENGETFKVTMIRGQFAPPQIYRGIAQG